MTRPPSLILLLTCAVLAGGPVAVGCGGDDEAASATTSTAAETTTAGEEAESTDEIEIADFKFDPEAVTVEAGTKVTWTNGDEAPHTATADDGSFDTGTLDLDDSKPVTLDEPGTYSYLLPLSPVHEGNGRGALMRDHYPSQVVTVESGSESAGNYCSGGGSGRG